MQAPTSESFGHLDMQVVAALGQGNGQNATVVPTITMTSAEWQRSWTKLLDALAAG